MQRRTRERLAEQLARGDTGLHRMLQWAFAAFECFMRILGPLLVLFATVLISYVVWAYFFVLMPLQTPTLSTAWSLTTVLGLWILYNIFFNYFSCVLTSPGHPTSNLPPSLLYKLLHSSPPGTRTFSQESLNTTCVGAPTAAAEASAPNHVDDGGIFAAFGVTPATGSTRSASSSAAPSSAASAAAAANPSSSSTPPSSTSSSSTPPSSSSSSSSPADGGEFTTWCKFCDNVKPPRCHHDHVTNQCVLKMDHYCPWMANCVGWGNYRFFLLFLVYMWVGAVFAAAVAARPFFHGAAPDIHWAQAHPNAGTALGTETVRSADPTETAALAHAVSGAGASAGASAVIGTASGAGSVAGTSPGVDGLASSSSSSSSSAPFDSFSLVPAHPPPGWVLPKAGRTAVGFTFIVSIAVGVAVGFMLAWHLYLTITNQTTIEFYYNRSRQSKSSLEGRVWRNPFDLGLQRNWESVFGRSRFTGAWLCPSRAKAVGNGYEWASVDDPNPSFTVLTDFAPSNSTRRRGGVGSGDGGGGDGAALRSSASAAADRAASSRPRREPATDVVPVGAVLGRALRCVGEVRDSVVDTCDAVVGPVYRRVARLWGGGSGATNRTDDGPRYLRAKDRPRGAVRAPPRSAGSRGRPAASAASASASASVSSVRGGRFSATRGDPNGAVYDDDDDDDEAVGGEEGGSDFDIMDDVNEDESGAEDGEAEDVERGLVRGGRRGGGARRGVQLRSR